MTYFSEKKVPWHSVLNLLVWNLWQPIEVSPTPKAAIQVSGGQDSMLLLWCIRRVQNCPERRFTNFHYNHGWQVSNMFMGETVLKMSFWVKCPSVEITTTYTIRSELAARTWRYQQTHRLGSYYALETVFQGHSKTDALEFRFFQFLRNTYRTNIPGGKNGTTTPVTPAVSTLETVFHTHQIEQYWPLTIHETEKETRIVTKF